ncbi:MULTISPECIES: MerR family transcriptional regulator [unclassified Streptomyces]|uniref:MerR family transcriptional regulator n=1 Tax=unclassified Streptomyces TaxID=2593676 RepID=UPI00278BB3DC|nr:MULTISPECIES: MerR family transcriptional regulator [unclassified Streptomyces]
MTVMETTPRSRAATRKTHSCASAPPPHPRPEGQDHYTISEVVALTGLTAHTLRWYERIGLMPDVDRSHTGQRRYSNRDLDWLALVGKLRLTGMPVADMVRYAELVRRGEETFHERRELLEATRRDVLNRMAELQDTLAVLDYKIDIYAGARPAPERA